MKLAHAIPILRSFDETKAKEFYVDFLGFTVDWEHRFEPNFPVFMEISREGMSIYLTEHTGDCQVGGLVHFCVPDVDVWYADLLCRGTTVQEPPNESLEGLRMMTVFDPDGNQLRVMTRLQPRI